MKLEFAKKEVSIQRNEYSVNDNTAIELWSRDLKFPQSDMFDNSFSITKNLEKLPNNKCYLDIDLPDVEEFVQKYGIGKPTGLYSNKYPLYELNLERLDELEAKYNKHWGI